MAGCIDSRAPTVFAAGRRQGHPGRVLHPELAATRLLWAERRPRSGAKQLGLQLYRAGSLGLKPQLLSPGPPRLLADDLAGGLRFVRAKGEPPATLADVLDGREFLAEEPCAVAGKAGDIAAGQDPQPPGAFRRERRIARAPRGEARGVELALAQAVIYLGTAPKSNAAYAAFGAARRSAAESGSLMPPMHILNAPTRMMRDLGYGKGYAYDHDAPDGFSGQDYFPDGMARQAFYRPVERGFEREIAKRLEYWARLRAERARGAP